jgi:hypothetical protein
LDSDGKTDRNFHPRYGANAAAARNISIVMKSEWFWTSSPCEEDRTASPRRISTGMWLPTTIEFDGPMNTGEGMKRVQQFAFSRISGFYSIPEGTDI